MRLHLYRNSVHVSDNPTTSGHIRHSDQNVWQKSKVLSITMKQSSDRPSSSEYILIILPSWFTVYHSWSTVGMMSQTSPKDKTHVWPSVPAVHHGHILNSQTCSRSAARWLKPTGQQLKYTRSEHNTTRSIGEQFTSKQTNKQWTHMCASSSRPLTNLQHRHKETQSASEEVLSSLAGCSGVF